MKALRKNHHWAPRKKSQCKKCCKKVVCLSPHMQVHKEVLPLFKCASCDVGFTTKSSLSHHCKNTRAHASGETFACKVCGDMFPTEAIMNVHLEANHAERTEMEPIQGPVIKREVEAVDVGPCKMKCKLCKKMVVTRNDLTPFMIPGDASNEDLLQCFSCKIKKPPSLTEKDADREGSDPDPKSSDHNGYSCAFCSRAPFSSELALQAHILIHIEEKPFSCKYCGSSYRNEEVLDKHLHHRHGDSRSIRVIKIIKRTT